MRNLHDYETQGGTQKQTNYQIAGMPVTKEEREHYDSLTPFKQYDYKQELQNLHNNPGKKS